MQPKICSVSLRPHPLAAEQRFSENKIRTAKLRALEVYRLVDDDLNNVPLSFVDVAQRRAEQVSWCPGDLREVLGQMLGVKILLNDLQTAIDPSIFSLDLIGTQSVNLHPSRTEFGPTGCVSVQDLVKRYPFHWFRNSMDGSTGVPFIDILRCREKMQDDDEPFSFPGIPNQMRPGEIYISTDNFYYQRSNGNTSTSRPELIYYMLELRRDPPTGLKTATVCIDPSHPHTCHPDKWRPIPLTNFCVAFLAVIAVIKHLMEKGNLDMRSIKLMKLHALFTTQLGKMNVWHPIVSGPLNMFHCRMDVEVPRWNGGASYA